MSIHLDHVIIFVANMQHSLDFYCNIIGLKSLSTSAGWSEIDAGPGPKLALHATQETQPAAALSHSLPPGQIQLTFMVTDIDSLCAVLRAHGAPVDGPGDQPEIRLRTAYLRDPDGTALQLAQPL